MHAVVIKVKIDDLEAAEKALHEEVVPQIGQIPGVVGGYWARKDDSGLSMVLFESEDAAKAMSERAPTMVADGVTFDSIEVREVVAQL